jgi:hypothetical protein
MQAQEERRTESRVNLSLDLYADYAGRCRPVHDLSLSGAFIEDGQCLPTGGMLTLWLWLNEYEQVEAKAAVERAEKGHGMGVRFVGVSEAQRDRLRRYLRAIKGSERH